MVESGKTPVKVMSMAGTFLFECSMNKAKYLVLHKQAIWVSRRNPPIIKSTMKDLRPINMTRPLKTNLYGNFHVLSPEGDIMFHCNEDKINWYLTRNLADKISPTAIQLRFKPNGPGHMGDHYYMSQKENKCVVCGTESQLTRHHVIPYCYRRYFP